MTYEEYTKLCEKYNLRRFENSSYSGYYINNTFYVICFYGDEYVTCYSMGYVVKPYSKTKDISMVDFEIQKSINEYHEFLEREKYSNINSMFV